MVRDGFSKKAGAGLILLLIVTLVFAAGCEFWPFASKDTAEEALKLKNETNKIFTTAEKHADDFDAFLKKLNKRWYTAKDAKEFESSLSIFKNQVDQDKTDLSQVSSKLTKLASLDEKKQFSEFIDSKTKASGSLEKTIDNTKKIVEALSPKISKVALLYSQVDEVKQSQNRYIAVVEAVSQRETQAVHSRVALLRLLASLNPEPTEDEGSETGDGDSKDEDETTEKIEEVLIPENTNIADSQPLPVENKNSSNGNISNSAADDGSGGSTDSTASEESPPWVYIILEEKWPSVFLRDFAQESADNFSKHHQEVYALHQELKFQNSRRLTQYLQEVKDDNEGYAASLDALIENLQEQKRLNSDKDRYERFVTAYETARTIYRLAAENRPAGVSSSSKASEGVSFGGNYSDEEVTRYKEKLKGVNERLKTLEEAYEGSLSTEYKETKWKFAGSLLALHKLNRKISRSLMHESKRWKKKAITKYVYLRMQHLAAAKNQNNKADQAYKEAKNKIAAK